ncbi:MAG: precorrin-2 C(20)-methyltransferase [Lachnospiraceae bacterium]|nr:precorrin-2 C(20)-methyltransferase [Lachnospiraceae bacterium]
MTGTLFGVGVGPGNPMQMTYEAVEIIKQTTHIAIPTAKPYAADTSFHNDTTSASPQNRGVLALNEILTKCSAYQIALGQVPELPDKKILPVYMPMTKNAPSLEKAHQEGAALIQQYLDSGHDVAFLTLGDPTVYSTYMYVQQRLLPLGYNCRIISGIPSFCASAAELTEALSVKDEMIHVIPASYPTLDALHFPGTKVFMKSGKQLPRLLSELREHPELYQSVQMVENCGMPTQKCYSSLEEIPENAGYFTTIIVK